MVKLCGPAPWAAALAVGLAMVAMHLTGTFHPPAGIDPLVVVVNNMSWSFLVTPVGIGALLLALFAFVWHKLAAHYRRSPDQLSEEEVRAYILNLREGGAARGTFKANYYGIQYLDRYTVNRDWALFTKKTFVCRNRSGYPRTRRRRGSPAAWLHNEPDPQNLLCRHVRLRSADWRGGNP